MTRLKTTAKNKSKGKSKNKSRFFAALRMTTMFLWNVVDVSPPTGSYPSVGEELV
jgi:hypothetical protein